MNYRIPTINISVMPFALLKNNITNDLEPKNLLDIAVYSQPMI
jgi:hypothetical protein